VSSNSSDKPDVLHKADVFLARRRAQLDSAVIDSPHEAEPATMHDDDIPVLTDIVPDPFTELTGLSVPQPLLTLSMNALNSSISHAMDKWLDERLPEVVAQAMDGMTDQLIRQIHQSAEQELLPRLNRALRGDIDED
jgi:hypothetical protein